MTQGAGWVLTPEKLDRLAAACLSESCRTTVAGVRRSLTPPIAVTPDSGPFYACVGPYPLRSREQLVRKVAQFPKGTQFRLYSPSGGTWLREQWLAQIRGILKSAGMRVVD